MKTSLILAAFLLAGGAAQAQNSFSFEINGQKVRVGAPKRCSDSYCLSVSTKDKDGTTSSNTVNVQDIISKLQGVTGSKDDSSSEPDQTSETTPASPASSPAPRTSAAIAPAVAAPAPVETAAPSNTAQTNTIQPANSPDTQAAAPSALGIWQTEKKEGKVHIVQCGQNLCGYVMDTRTQADGEKILMDLKPTGTTKWNGRIRDARGGGMYDSTVTLKNPDTLRVQGCAFGGFVCGGQTWSRI